jgi:hypothetical protein
MTANRAAGTTSVILGVLLAFAGMWMLWPPMAILLVGIAAVCLGVLLVVEV